MKRTQLPFAAALLGFVSFAGVVPRVASTWRSPAGKSRRRTRSGRRRSRQTARRDETAATREALKRFTNAIEGSVLRLSKSLSEIDRLSLEIIAKVDGPPTELDGETQNAAEAEPPDAPPPGSIQDIYDRLRCALDAVDHPVRNDVDLTTDSASLPRLLSELKVLIADMSEQSSVLALSAMIAAAEAGNASGELADFAREVEMLAKQTTQMTDAIAQRIERMQGTAMMDSIRSANASLEQVAAAIAGPVGAQSATGAPRNNADAAADSKVPGEKLANSRGRR